MHQPFETGKKNYYSDLDTNIFESNKKFWDRIKPLFSAKPNLEENIRLTEGGKIISDKKEVAEILNNYFIEAVENLDVERYDTNDTNFQEELDEIDKIVRKFHEHPSIRKIKEKIDIKEKFKFNDITTDSMFKKISSLDPKKGCMIDDIPFKILLGTNDIK